MSKKVFLVLLGPQKKVLPLRKTLKNFFDCKLTQFDRDGSDKHCVALYDYDKQCSEELQLYKGHKIMILQDPRGQNWWRGRNLENGQEGWLPSNYVKMVCIADFD